MIASPKIGHNEPPTPIEYAERVINDLNLFLSDHPVIETEEQAREAKPYLDRAKATLDEIEAERDGKVRPLNTHVAEINAEYKAVHNTDAKKPGRYDKIVNELKARLAAFMKAEEDRRWREAEEARCRQLEAERIAREAEAKEHEAIENAKVGMVVDVAEVTQQATDAFAEYERQSRFADRAVRDTKVKIDGGFGKTAALRDVETLRVDNYNRAIKAIGPHEKIAEAIISCAREYRKAHGSLPDGVTATTERTL